MIVIAAQAGIGFPKGSTAATARISCYARGLHAAGHEVVVLCLGTSEPTAQHAALNTEVRGVVDGVLFEYACGTTVRGRTVWRRRWLRFRGLVAAARRVRQLAAGPGVEAVLLYSSSSVEAGVLFLAARAAGAAYVVDLCELPFSSLHGIKLWRLRRDLHDHTFFRWFDGVIAISEYLRRHALAHGAPAHAVTLAPVMVDTDEFQHAGAAATTSSVVMYCGMLNQEKDGVESLLTAFAGLSGDLPEARLMLVGDTYRGTLIPEFRAIAERLGVSDRVQFVGNVQHSEIPEYMSRADVLVLARPRTPQADAGMPTKVAEYLASGVPVITTRVGEIAQFLDDGKSAYLVPPGDERALEAALRHALSHPEEARLVGLAGRAVAAECFDYRVVGAHVARFITGLSGVREQGGASG